MSLLGGLGVSRSGSQIENVKIAREALKEHYGEQIGFIDYKRFAEPGDLYHFVDGRGSNSFQTKAAVCAFGIANTNVGAAKCEYEALTGKLVGSFDATTNAAFKDYYLGLRQSELDQEIGRLRAVRRLDEDLTFYSFSNMNLRFLENKGYTVKVLRGYELDYRLNSHKDTIIQAIEKLAVCEEYQAMGVASFNQLANVGVQVIHNIFQKNYQNRGGWVKFTRDLIAEIELEPRIILTALSTAINLDEYQAHNVKYVSQILDFYLHGKHLKPLAKDFDDYYDEVAHNTEELRF
jgi:hypothetical protein